jgi:rhodanese-related sulfurtransferase
MTSSQSKKSSKSSKRVSKSSRKSSKSSKRVSKSSHKSPKKHLKTKKTRKTKVPTTRLCNTCFKVKIIDGNLLSKSTESWKDFPYHLPVLGRKSGSQTVNINLGKKHSNALIYYFAAGSNNSVLHGKYPKSYKKSTNTGLVKLDKKGKCQVKLDCPMSYQDTNFSKTGKQTYLSHLHMLVSNKDMTQWLNKLMTQNVLCHITKNQVQNSIKNKNRLIINALSPDYFKQNAIPTSFNLPASKAKTMSIKEIKESVLTMVKNNNELKGFIGKHNLKLTEVPITVYCYSKKCSASHDLAMELFRAGFTNVTEYKDGIMGWMGRGSSC